MTIWRRRILIGCPHYQQYVTGSYQCHPDGRYLLRADGTFDPARAKCGQCGGRCSQPLCALHRFNHKHPGTWFPTDILALREGCHTHSQ